MGLLSAGWRIAEGMEDGPLRFSRAMPHGLDGLPFGHVMMTRVKLGGSTFVHGSDIQLLDDATVDAVLEWSPDIVLAAGPPLYQNELLSEDRVRAWENAKRLAKKVRILILDHHLLRSAEGVDWLKALSETVERRVYCAADFMGPPRRLLEAERQDLYRVMPVKEGWHEAYARGLASVKEFAAG